jgi:hypothetical protein
MAEPKVKQPGLWRRVREALTRQSAGYAYPSSRAFGETAVIPLKDVMQLYERDPTCKASVDLLASAAVGMGFYTTANEEYDQAEDAKDVVDEFNESVNLDGLLNDMAKTLIACGNDFWVKLMPERLADVRRIPVGFVEKIEPASHPQAEFLSEVAGFKLHRTYGGETLKPEAVIHWRINCADASSFGTGILQVLLHTLTINSDKRPAYAWMKSKIERIMPKIFEKYAGPDVLASLPDAKDPVIQKFESAIKNRGEEGAWLFYSGKNPAKLDPVTIDPRARFEYYIDHIVNQFYLGCETPLPRLFSTPGFTEASAKAALDLQNMLIKPIQRYIKRQVERELFVPVLQQAGFDPAAAGVRLNFGSPELPEVKIADMLKAAELGLIRGEEFRKNVVKFGWELWDVEQQGDSSQDTRSEEVT